jgi:hypothetical protein
VLSVLALPHCMQLCRYDHLKNFISEMFCASSMFLLNKLPEYSQNMQGLERKCSKHAGLEAMYFFCLHVGAPNNGWIRGARSELLALQDVVWRC